MTGPGPKVEVFADLARGGSPAAVGTVVAVEFAIILNGLGELGQQLKPRATGDLANVTGPFMQQGWTLAAQCKGAGGAMWAVAAAGPQGDWAADDERLVLQAMAR